MRLLLVGASSKYAIELPYFKYLREFPEFDQVEFFEAQNMFLEYYQKSIINKILYRLGYSQILKKINSKLIEKVDDFKPDVILVFKGMEIFPETLEKIKATGILLSNYNPDNPYIFSGRGSGNKNITNSIGLYDVHFTYSKSILSELNLKHPKSHVYYLPFGFDVDDDLYEECKKQQEIVKVCFLGNPDKYRAKFIEKLCELGIKIDVYGNNWQKYISHNNCTSFDGVYDLDLWKTLAKYRVQLNIMRPHNMDSHNMRTFEIPAIGGIELAPNTPEHRLFFNEGKEIFLYQNEQECVSKICQLLELSFDQASKIRENARNKCVSSKYSYYWRSKEIANYFNGIFKLNP